MDYHCILEGVFKQLEITVGLTVRVSDSDIAAPLEKIRICGESDGEAPGIFPQILVDGVKIAAKGENLVIEALSEDAWEPRPLVDHHLKSGQFFFRGFHQGCSLPRGEYADGPA